MINPSPLIVMEKPTHWYILQCKALPPIIFSIVSQPRTTSASSKHLPRHDLEHASAFLQIIYTQASISLLRLLSAMSRCLFTLSDPLSIGKVDLGVEI
jgi:hypothetical protein